MAGSHLGCIRQETCRQEVENSTGSKGNVYA